MVVLFPFSFSFPVSFLRSLPLLTLPFVFLRPPCTRSVFASAAARIQTDPARPAPATTSARTGGRQLCQQPAPRRDCRRRRWRPEVRRAGSFHRRGRRRRGRAGRGVLWQARPAGALLSCLRVSTGGDALTGRSLGSLTPPASTLELVRNPVVTKASARSCWCCRRGASRAGGGGRQGGGRRRCCCGRRRADTPRGVAGAAGAAGQVRQAGAGAWMVQRWWERWGSERCAVAQFGEVAARPTRAGGG